MARAQGGHGERLDRIDFVVFNQNRDGLIAGQGELGSPTAKLALLPSEQDNSMTLSMASQRVRDTLQGAPVQAMEGSGQVSRQEQGNPGIGPRMV